MMYTIDLRFYGFLNEYTVGNNPNTIVQCEAGSSVKELLDKMKVPLETVGLIYVNDILADLQYQIRNGDKVKIYPVVLGA